jgi:hypothetical protein
VSSPDEPEDVPAAVKAAAADGGEIHATNGNTVAGEEPPPRHREVMLELTPEVPPPLESPLSPPSLGSSVESITSSSSSQEKEEMLQDQQQRRVSIVSASASRKNSEKTTTTTTLVELSEDVTDFRQTTTTTIISKAARLAHGILFIFQSPTYVPVQQ